VRWWHLTLAVVGTIVPYSFFAPWLLEHGLNIRLMVTELFSTRVGAFFGCDVFVSAMALLSFIRRDGKARNISLRWVPMVATCLVGVSCGLPLFLFLRERQLASDT
jgi:hypothetical protein